MNTSAWDDEPASPTGRGREELAEEYVRLADQRDNLDARLEALKETLAGDFPEEPGEWSAVHGRYTVTCKRSERWLWDQDKLTEHFLGGIVPDYVTKRLTIARKAFEKLDDAERRPLLDALERKPSSPSIAVTRRGDA